MAAYGLTVLVLNGVYDQPEIAAPANPASGFDRVYMDSTTHKWTCLTSSGGSCAASGGVSASGFYLNDGTHSYIGLTNQIATLPLAGTYAWINQGSATETAVQNGLVLHAPASAGGTSLNLRAAAISTNTVVTMALICNIVQGGAGATACLAGFFEGSSGKVETIEIVNGFLQINRFADVHTFASNIFNSMSPGLPPLVWIRLTISGGNISYSYSIDGVNFPLMYSEAQNAYFNSAPDNWFYAVDTEGTTAQDTYATLLSWLATP